MGEHAGSSRAASGGEPGRSIERVSADQHPVGEPGFDQVRDHVDQTPVSWMAGAVGPVESEKRAGAGELQSRPERGLRIIAVAPTHPGLECERNGCHRGGNGGGC